MQTGQSTNLLEITKQIANFTIMETNQLRIGNIVFDEEQNANDIITSIEEERVSLVNGILPYTPADRVHGIPLTEEGMVKFGGKRMSGWVGLKFNFPVWDEDVDYTFELMDGILTLYCNDIRLKKIEKPTFHQLQNIFHDLSSRELEVKND